jgi:hypothetical protein
VARYLGAADDEAAWSKLEDRYRGNILKGVAASTQSDGYVPPGLYKYLTGPAARSGFAEWLTGHDWENMLLAYPGELLSPADPRVRGTVDHVRKNYAAGVVPYGAFGEYYAFLPLGAMEAYFLWSWTRCNVTRETPAVLR